MPKKVVNKLDKVISTKVSQDVFNALAQTARSTYLRNDISQPTISETLRFMIEIFMDEAEASDDKFLQLSSDLQKTRKQKTSGKRTGSY
jgi:hypothetical protein